MIPEWDPIIKIVGSQKFHYIWPCTFIQYRVYCSLLFAFIVYLFIFARDLCSFPAFQEGDRSLFQTDTQSYEIRDGCCGLQRLHGECKSKMFTVYCSQKVLVHHFLSILQRSHDSAPNCPSHLLCRRRPSTFHRKLRSWILPQGTWYVHAPCS